MITTLMLKTHNVTGLKYFCQTRKEGKARDRYRGSGIRWSNHIRKHGGGNKFVTTEIVAEYDWDNPNFEEEISTFALKYSSDHNIVDDPNYANLEPENGLDGGVPGQKPWNKGKKTGPQSPEHISKLSEVRKGKIAWNKGRPSPLKGRPRTAETVAKMKGKPWTPARRAAQDLRKAKNKQDRGIM